MFGKTRDLGVFPVIKMCARNMKMLMTSLALPCVLGAIFLPPPTALVTKKNICGDEMAFCEISVLRNQIMEHACVSYFGEKMSQAVEVVVEVAAAPSENEFCGTSWHARQVLRSRNLVGSGAGE